MEQKVALVTGGSQGIGEAICRRLADEGMTVIVASRSQEKIETVAASIRERGGRAHAQQLDVGDIDAGKQAIKNIVAEYGGLHVLVNNAGIAKDNLMARIKPDDFDAVINVNLRGSFFLTQAAIRPMIRQRWGRIVNISSVVGLMGNLGQSNYAASKAGVIGVTKSLAREVGSRCITVNAVAPGYIETEMTQDLNEKVKEAFLTQVPCGRFGQSEEVADAVAFLAGERAAYITGQVLTIDGGLYM